jgi:hypothetical protein
MESFMKELSPLLTPDTNEDGRLMAIPEWFHCLSESLYPEPTPFRPGRNPARSDRTGADCEDTVIKGARHENAKYGEI